MLKKILGISCLLAVCNSMPVLAQGQGNSPYSVIGIGEPAEPTTVVQDGMGGTGVSYANGFSLNTLNVALLPKNRVVGGYRYVAWSVGMKGRLNNMQTTATTQRDFGFNLNNIGMAFPVKTYWTTAVTLNPYSIVDHHAIRRVGVTGSNTETLTYDMQSRGGVAKVAWMNGFRIGKSFYAGLETSYLFGTISHDTTSVVSSLAFTYLRNSARSSYRGYQLKPGVAYTHKLTDKWQLNTGATYETGVKLTGERLLTFSTLNDQGNGLVLSDVPDTVSFNTNHSARVPSAFRVGASLESPFKWVLAAEYGRRNWSEVNNPLLSNSSEFNLGAEYVPNVSSTNYFNQIFYRLGYRYMQTPYILNGTRITDRSFTAGLSVPLGFNSASYVDLNVAFGRRGVTANSLVQENYIKMGVNFSLLTNKWFIKPVID